MIVKTDHQIQEYKQPKTIEESDFELALSNSKIAARTEEDLKQSLRYVYILIGLPAKYYPAGIEKQMLHAFIFKNYGGHSPEEIRLAFEMGIQGKLEDLEPKDVVAYDNFSIAFFTKVMEAYRKWARVTVKLVDKPKKSEPTFIERVYININYAYYLFKQINKLPIKL